MSDSGMSPKQKASTMASGHRLASNLIMDIGALLLLLTVSLVTYDAIFGPPRSPPSWQLPAFWFIIGFSTFLSAVLLYSGSRPSLAKANGGFVLLRRRLFGELRAKERIPLESIAKTHSVSAGRVKFGEERPPLVLLELVDGRRFRFSRPQVGDETYAALAALADRQRSPAD